VTFAPVSDRQPFSLLTCLYGDAEMAALLSGERLVAHYLATEQALARAQAAAGVLDPADAEAIGSLEASQLDLDALWHGARNVGYPILGLVRQMAALLPEGPNGRVHFAATTQDIMDTGTILQTVEALDLLTRRLTDVGDRLAEHVQAHRSTVMPGRTHGQHAVPTTFGAHLAPLLAELARHLQRLAAARDAVATLSLFGAGGTSAAGGPSATQVRQAVARDLGLHAVEVPWHTSRDNLIQAAHTAALVSSACARLARNMVDLSRTEIGEIHEAEGLHRGASSTMPQKANPILAEGIIGMSAVVGPLTAALSRAAEVPQERAAGEWQVEWHVLPQVLQLTSSSLLAASELLAGLRVDPARMRDNLALDGGLIMAEAYMFQLAPELGREKAHDLVYAAARQVRAGGTTLAEAVAQELTREGQDTAQVQALDAGDYLGQAEHLSAVALQQWQERRAADSAGERAAY
jgi:3-carboxy-cis,cis-muconate cycloisomerase